MQLEYKLKKVLYLFGLMLFFIFLRVWFLSVINYEKMQKLSVLPRRKTLTLNPTRGLITDKNHVLLAKNKKCFEVLICYMDIKQIPQNEYLIEHGVKVKFPKRKTYIQDLSRLLEDHVNLKAEDIEDFIYAKAALFQDIPVLLQEGISEKSYHVLKALEKDWPGLRINISQKRDYPGQKLGCHVVGYLGAIDELTYKKASLEKKILKEYIDAREKGLTPPLPQGFNNPFEVRERYNELCEKSFNLTDLVGKDGIEKSFDHKLRGGAGKKMIETTRLGHIISELPGSYSTKKPANIELSIDIKLQEEAEKLLSQRESNDDLFPKGGACVVLDIKNSKVLAHASYPRFNPQDFIDKNQDKIHKWTESSSYIRSLYEGIQDIEKEKYSFKLGFFEAKTRLSYEMFLERLLSQNSSCLGKIKALISAKHAYDLLDSFEKLHEKYGFIEPNALFSELESSIVQDEETNILYEPLKKHLKGCRDKVLFFDIVRLLIDTKKMKPGCLNFLDSISLDELFSLTQGLAQASKEIEKNLKEPFETHIFSLWKKDHFKTHLKKKRQEETLKKTYARPFTDYLEEEKRKQYQQFIIKYKKYLMGYLIGKIPNLKKELSCLQPSLDALKNHSSILHLQKVLNSSSLEQTASFLHFVRSFDELNRPLYGTYPRLLEKKKHTEKDLAMAFYPKYKLGYMRSNAHRFLAPQGSVFKIAVAYEAIKQRLEGRIKKLPLIFDALSKDSRNKKNQILGYDEKKHPIYRWHKGGLLPRSSHSGIGQVDVISALEQSSNIYFSILASEYIDSPLNLLESAKHMGLGEKTLIDLPFELKGKLPDDLLSNKTGLYAFAIGQHELLVTPLQTALMVASLFQDGKVLKPQIIQNICEEKTSYADLFSRIDEGAYSDSLCHLGCFFPLFTETLKASKNTSKHDFESHVLKHYALTKEILDPIKKGLDKVVWGEKGTARPQAIASMLNPKELEQYMHLKHLMIGKTGTAEQRVIETLDQEAESRMYNHIWFACVSFKDASQKQPELAICVYLKDGKLGGKEAAPIAAKLIEFYKKQNPHD
jgi:cell division protein FtsI/penicillin-binding protein 2